jgi:adenylate kinase
MDEGNLVPDQVVIGMVDEKLKEGAGSHGFIFDGFPRTVPQAEALETLLKQKGQAIAGMIALDVPEEELKARIKERGKTSGRTDDQNEKKIENRIKVYLDETLPVANYFGLKNKFVKIEGVGTIEGIFENISTEIDKLK